jgi:uncharacterized protein (UPF0276 family)
MSDAGSPPWVGLSLMLEEDFRGATAPLFEEEAVDVLEWSFDTGWGRDMPHWADELLDFYAEAGRLFGHGVTYSPLSAAWEPRQARWLDDLAREVARRPYVHVSEHYGLMTTPRFTRGAPLPLPRSAAVLEVAHDRMRRLREIASCPIGIENLALAWNRTEALADGRWLEALSPRDDDFVVLDVHNLYCQLVNFGIDIDEALDGYPLARVREIHVSGGSELAMWPGGADVVRCDTHDGRVPEAVFDLLARALDRCPSVTAVVFERLGGSIRDAAAAEGVRADYRRVRAIAAAPREKACADVVRPSPSAPVITDDVGALARMQSALLVALLECDAEADLRESLARSTALEPYRELFATAESGPLGIASRVTKKYARRG